MFFQKLIQNVDLSRHLTLINQKLYTKLPKTKLPAENIRVKTKKGNIYPAGKRRRFFSLITKGT